MRPGGENGGAKTLALEVVAQLARLAPSTEFLLLTSSISHDELAGLDSGNISRICVIQEQSRRSETLSRRMAWFAGRHTPLRMKELLGSPYGWWVRRQARRRNLRRLGLDLLFCPFTAPFLPNPGVPVVSVVHDLQFLAYPQFFSRRELDERRRSFEQARRVARVIVCPSEYVRSRLLAVGGIEASRVVVIHNTPDRRGSSPEAYQPLSGFRYLLYPANFWPHKNHEMLLAAYGMLVQTEGSDAPHLVFTGAPGERQDRMLETAAKMRLGERVHFAGYVSDGEYAAILGGCEALVFPSLYEGFGMPVLEAMKSGKPVLCSNVTSLPEVAGEAAVYFDPGSASSIAGAMSRVAGDETLRSCMARAGVERARELGTGETMARRYWQAFEDALD